MDTPGIVLKTERERQGKSLEEISNDLKFNKEYLKAIENDNYKLIPAEIYTKAYLKSYAQALGIDQNMVIDLYKKQTEPQSVQKPVIPQEKKSFSLKPVIIIIALLLIGAVVAMFLGQERPKPVMEPSVEMKEQQPSGEIKEQQQPAVTEEPKVIGPETTATGKDEQPKTALEETAKQEQEAPAVQAPDKLSLMISSTDITWISARVDGGEPQEWLLKPGEEISLTASEGFVIKTGNAGGTKIIFNGEDIGSIGEHGKVVELNLPKQ